MNITPADRILELLEAKASTTCGPMMIATDADGTLWTGDVGVDVFESMLDERAIREDALPALRELAEAHGIADGCDPNVIAGAAYDAYQRHSFSEIACYELMAWAFAGYSVEQATAFARRVQKLKGLEARLHPEMKRIVEWAAREGIPVWVVSASPRAVVQAGASLLGIDADSVVAATPAQAGQHILPRMAEPLPYGPAKCTALRKVAPTGTIIGAFGDNVFDIEMLCTASLAVAVRPKDGLLRRAEDVPGLLQMAPE